MIRPIHPFENLTRKFGDIVAYKGNFFIGGATIQTLNGRQNGGTQETPILIKDNIKRKLICIGPVKDYISKNSLENQSPSQHHKRPTHSEEVSLESFAAQTIRYYQNPKKQVKDLLEEIDQNFAQQEIIEQFKHPHLLTKSFVASASTLGKDSVAFLSAHPQYISFTPQINKHLSSILETLKNTDPSRKIYHIIPPPLGLERINFITSIPSFTTSAEGNEYAFPGVDLITKCMFFNKKILLEEYPRPTIDNYRHFFIYRSGNMCYDGDARFKNIGMVAGKWYPINDKTLPYKLARVIEQGLLNLTQGYKPGCHPAQLPSSLSQFLIKSVA